MLESAHFKRCPTSNMSSCFFKDEKPQEKCTKIVCSDMGLMLSNIAKHSLLILDIDDTIGRVSQTIGLAVWFHFRMQQFIEEGSSPKNAKVKTITLYQLVQLVTETLVPVDPSCEIAKRLKQLQTKGVKVIALTSRSTFFIDKTLKQLSDLNVAFSKEVLKDCTLLLNDEQVVIKEGVIFANGNDKGACLKLLKSNHVFLKTLHSFPEIHFIDDSDQNCDSVVNFFTEQRLNKATVCNYDYMKKNYIFDSNTMRRANMQELFLLKKNTLLSDNEADVLLEAHTSSLNTLLN